MAHVSTCCASALLSYQGWKLNGRRVKAGARAAVPFKYCRCQTEAS